MPATAPQSSGATTASEVFSATDSTVARATSARPELGRVPADQVAHLPAPAARSSACQLTGHGARLPAQRAPAQHAVQVAAAVSTVTRRPAGPPSRSMIRSRPRGPDQEHHVPGPGDRLSA